MATIFTRQSELGDQLSAQKRTRAGRAFSISRCLASMSNGLLLDGYEREVIDEIHRAQRGTTEMFRMPIPLALLADPTTPLDVLVRDMGKGTLNAGGYLVGATASPISHLLTPWSVAAKAGMTSISAQGGNLSGDIQVPKVSAGMTANWLNGELATITASDPTIEKVTLSPKSAAAKTSFGRLLARQGDVADALLQKEMLRTVGALVDAAILAGTGTNGQPLGILNHPGTKVVTPIAGDSTVDWNLACSMEACAAMQGMDESIAFVAHPYARLTMKTTTGPNPWPINSLWLSTPDGDSVIGRRAYASVTVPPGYVVCGPWSDVIFALWGSPVIELNPNDPVGFKSGRIDARLIMDCDVAVCHPAAWSGTKTFADPSNNYELI